MLFKTNVNYIIVIVEHAAKIRFFRPDFQSASLENVNEWRVTSSPGEIFANVVTSQTNRHDLLTRKHFKSYLIFQEAFESFQISPPDAQCFWNFLMTNALSPLMLSPIKIFNDFTLQTNQIALYELTWLHSLTQFINIYPI